MYFVIWHSKNLYLETQSETQVIDYINHNHTGEDLPIVIKGQRLISVTGKRTNVERLVPDGRQQGNKKEL